MFCEINSPKQTFTPCFLYVEA